LSTPIFSIVIPTFNRAHILGEAVLSVKNQTLKDWELLLVDDGSTDTTDQLVMTFIESDSRVRFFQRDLNRTKGPSSCRNIGIQNSNGQYIAFLDSDDSWESRRLENIFEFIQSTGATAIYSGANVRKLTGSYQRGSRQIEPSESLFDFLLKPDSFIPTPSIVVTSDLAKRVCFNEKLTCHEDYDFIMRASESVCWTFYPGYEVIVDWREELGRQINYESCLWFFNTYKFSSRDKAARVNYLRYMAQDMVVRGSKYEFLTSYRKLLKDEDLPINSRDMLMFHFPKLYRQLFRWIQTLRPKTG
jgi:glycosyltransferase involved in cell wall biosynthesis